MNVTPKAVVQYHLKLKGLSPAELAKMLGVSVTNLNSTLAAPILHAESHWPAILNVLGLEVVIQRRQD